MNIYNWKFFPLVTAILLLAAYVISNAGLVNCNQYVSSCTAIDGENISEVPALKAGSETNCENIDDVPEHLKNNLKCTRKLLDKKREILSGKEDQLKSQMTAVEMAKKDLNETLKQLNEKKQAKYIEKNADSLATIEKDISSLSDRHEKQKLALATLESTLETGKTEKNEAQKAVVAVRDQVAQRYTKRIIFIFVTMAFILLSIAAIAVASATIKQALKSVEVRGVDGNGGYGLTFWWQILTVVVAVGFAASIYIFYKKEYMSIAGKLFEQSIWSNGDVSSGLVHFVNCFGFAATIWMLSAGNALFYAVMTKRGERVKSLYGAIDVSEDEYLDQLKEKKEYERGRLAEESLTDEEKQHITESIQNLESQIFEWTQIIKNKFAPYFNSVTSLLYLGALMLFVAMVRQKLLADWHLLFVSSGASTLLANFFNNMVGIQAAFYSILLLVIYLPVVYAIPAGDDPSPNDGVTLFDRLRLPFSSDFVKKFAAVFSPTLAIPVVEFLASVIG